MAQVGTWRNYLAYYDVQQIQAAGDDIFVLASNGLYQYNKNDQSIYTYDKVNGLSDTYITHIRWCSQAKRLIAVYQNSNIDLIETNGNVINISDLYNKVMTGDKTISNIRIDGIYAYLICGFGIVKVNMQRAEIADSYTPNHPEYPTSLPAEDNSDYEKYIDLVKTLKPGGPKYNYFYESKFINDKLYTTGGRFLSGTYGENNPGTVQIYDGNNWTVYPNDINLITGFPYKDINCIDIDPTNENHVAVAGRCGLYEFYNEQLMAYHYKDNSPLRPGTSSSSGKEYGNDYTLVHGIKYDHNGNLWVLNSQARSVNLLQFTNDGKWKTFYKKELNYKEDISCPGLREMKFDSKGLLWFVNANFMKTALFCYDIEQDIIYKYDSFVNQDGTVINIPGDGSVRCVTEDLDGNIWIGTTVGPLMLEKSLISNKDYYFTQIKVPRNDGTNYADYLMAGISINSIILDGAGRKWFGTNGNGAYLISADNMTQIQHFTTDNSKLISNNILSINVNVQSGEVFFLTDQGLCSYISDAVIPNTEMTSDNVWAYPNPVKPDYTGPITITGLTLNADIKILSSNGAIVNEGRSNGGTYIWDGCDKKGRKVTSGVYMVATATNNGEKGTVCKIAIIR